MRSHVESVAGSRAYLCWRARLAADDTSRQLACGAAAGAAAAAAAADDDGGDAAMFCFSCSRRRQRRWPDRGLRPPLLAALALPPPTLPGCRTCWWRAREVGWRWTETVRVPRRRQQHRSSPHRRRRRRCQTLLRQAVWPSLAVCRRQAPHHGGPSSWP